MAAQHAALPVEGEPLVLRLKCNEQARQAGSQLECSQDSPTEASPTYLSSLSSASSVLEAIRQAEMARAAILAGSAPKCHEVHTLLGSQTLSPSKKPWTLKHVGNIQFSHCGRYMAAVATGVPEPLSQGAVPGSTSVKETLSDIVILGLSNSQAPGSCIHCLLSPQLCWAPSAPQLSIACMPDSQLFPEQRPVAYVCDAVSAQCVHDMSIETMQEAVQAAADACVGLHPFYKPNQHADWSPSGRYLMLTWQLLANSEGLISVIDVWEDTVLGHSRYTGGLHGIRCLPGGIRTLKVWCWQAEFACRCPLHLQGWQLGCCQMTASCRPTFTI